MGLQVEKSRSFNLRHGCVFFFGLLWVGFSSIFLIMGIVSSDWIFIGIGSLFTLVGLAILAYGALQLFTRYLVGQPTFTLSNQHQLHVGEALTVNWHHSFPRNVIVDSLQVQLIMREIATYQQGTDTKTVTHNEVIDSYEEAGREYSAGEMIHGQYEFQIPLSGMHSFKVRRNEIKWIVQFKLAVARLPDFVDEYELTVLPQVVTHG